ncbi:hypothetical protein JZU51_01975, partial [bacterium]|nr:hypothetical protein [bacterium]
PTATTPAPTATTPAPTATGTPSTPPVGYVFVSPTPSGFEVGTPDGTAGLFIAGTYTIVDLGGSPVVVSHTPDNNYDLILYEYELLAGQIEMDQIIIGISQTNDGSYYEVFNWGDDDRDENTNVDYADLT